MDYIRERTTEEIDEIVRLLFSSFGSIESVSLSADKSLNQASRFVHVEFANKKSLRAVLTASEAEFVTTCEKLVERFGISKQMQQKSVKEIRSSLVFPYVQAEALNLELSAYMHDFEEAEFAERKAREKRSREADEDGFIQVKPRNKKRRKDKDGDKNKRGTGDIRSRGQKKKGGELKNFYRFQMREEKVRKLDELRKKFEEDRAKIAEMKATRKFRV